MKELLDPTTEAAPQTLPPVPRPRSLQRHRTGLAVENAGAPVRDGLGRAAAPECHARRPARLRLDRSNPEILFGGEDERLCAPHVVTHHVERLVAKDRNVPSGLCAPSRKLRAVANHDQAPAAAES